jgi:hypothetical protein
MTTETTTMTEATIYWDSQDPTNEGWACRVRFSDGHEETSGWDWPLTRDDELPDAVVTLAWAFGNKILASDVAVEGMCGTWLSD